MKKRIFVLLVLLCFLSQFDIAKAQYQTYLPVILSSGEKMSGLALLEISDGTTTVNLLAKEKETGFHLLSWRPQIIQPKDGGIYQDSSIAPGRDLVFAVDGTSNEIFNTRLNGDSQDDLIQSAQDLLRLLTKARNYSLTSWQDTPVYIKARAACETNTRYALIKNFTIQDVDNPYSQPFFTANKLVAMNNISIGIERGHWLGVAPGSGECADSSSTQDWQYSQLWAVNTALPTGIVAAMIRTSSGRILAGDNGSGNIRYSDDNGASWGSIVVAGLGNTWSFCQLASGRILMGDSGVLWRSDNNGANWASNVTPINEVYSIIQTKTGRVIISDYSAISGSLIYYSDDNGVTLNIISGFSINDGYRKLVEAENGNIIYTNLPDAYISRDNGLTWSILGDKIFNNQASDLIRLSDNRLLAFIDTGDLMIASSDNGESWYQVASIGTGLNTPLSEDIFGFVYAGINDDIYKSSIDNINIWTVETTLPGTNVRSILSTLYNVFAGETSQITAKSLLSAVMGNSNNCDDGVFVVNKQNVANLTHIFRDDGGVFSANLFPMTLPTTLFPAAPAVNDATYFGIDTTVADSGLFASLVFDLSTIITYTTSYTITWEYWTGAAWAALTVKDGTNNGTGVFRALGVNSVHWIPPSNWAANAVNGVTGYWVRARVSALVGTLTPPVQQNRNIYSVVNGYVEIASTEVLGDIPALSQILAHNRSDLDGPGGSAPNLYENRLIVGLRSYDRGPTFQAYLNAADEQNPFGLTVSVGTNTTFGNDINAPTGRSATYNPAGVEAMATRVLFTFGPTIARDYYGRFHAFVRAYRDGGSSTDFTVRLQVTNGSGGVTYVTDTAQLATTSRFEVLDFGMIKIPVAGSLGLSELGDTSTIAVQASAVNAAVNLIIYDLILIPTDEWAIDSNDKTNSTLSEVGKSGGFEKVLNIDSVTMPKFPIRSVVQRFGSNLITAIYNSVTPGEAILQANAQQRLWFFAMTTSATGAAYSWLAQPEISHSIQLYKQQRYLSLRGDR